MPPTQVERPDAEIKRSSRFSRPSFARADAIMKPDPGRDGPPAEPRGIYEQIRDLLAIEFRADRHFPTDDSGEGSTQHRES